MLLIFYLTLIFSGGYRKRPVAWNGLNQCISKNQVLSSCCHQQKLVKSFNFPYQISNNCTKSHCKNGWGKLIFLIIFTIIIIIIIIIITITTIIIITTTVIIFTIGVSELYTAFILSLIVLTVFFTLLLLLWVLLYLNYGWFQWTTALAGITVA